MNKPAFDPNKPFEVVGGGSKPAFDPSQPFEAVDSSSMPSQPEGLKPSQFHKDFSVGNMISNIPGSAYNLGKGIVQGVGAIGSGAMLGLKRLLPGEYDQVKEFDAAHPHPASEIPGMLKGAGKAIKERYGSLDAAKNTLENDPVGVLSDVSLAGGAVGSVLKASKFIKAGQVVSDVANAVNPVSIASKVVAAPITIPKNMAMKSIAKNANPKNSALYEKYGIDAPVSAVNDSKLLQHGEVLASKGFFGQPVVNRAKNAMDSIVKTADDAAAGGVHPTVAGKIFGKAQEDLLQKHHDTVSDLYSKVDLKKFGNNPIEAPNTTELLQKFASEESNADKFSKAGSEKSYYSEMLDNLKPKTVTKTSPIVDEFGGKITKTETIPSQIDPEAAKAWIKRINKQLSPAYRRNNPVMTGDPSKLKAIKNSLNQEFKDYIRPIDPQMASNLDKADKVYGESIQNLNDGIFKKVHDMKDTPDHLFDFLTSSGVSAPDLQKATSILDPSQLKEFQTSAFKKIITAAKTKTGNGFAPSSIEGQLKSLGEERVSAMLNPKQVQLLKDLDDLAKSMKGFTKISEGSPTAHLGKLSAIISSLGTGAFAPSILPGIITAISGMVAGDKAMSSMMRSKWLNNAAKGKSIPKKSVTVLSVNPSTALNATASANRIFGQDQNGGGNG